MPGGSAWKQGSLPGMTSGGFAAAFAASDLNALPQLASVFSTILFDNTVATIVTPDQFMDISFVGALTAAETIAPGAGLSFFLWILQEDNVTYGDGRMVAGTQYASTSYTPLQSSIGGIQISPGTAITNIAGSSLMIPIPPRKFGLVAQNNSGFAFAGGGVCSISISTYRQNTNA
jgi:hypothetical protein